MATNPWYPFYVGDYQQKTAHLSLAEHGAYRLLLDHFYATGAPLPSEKDVLFRICRAHNLAEKRVILSIISQFFYEKNGKYFHKKVEEILVKRQKYSDTQSANASARYDAKKMPARASTILISRKEKEEKENKPIPLMDVFSLPDWIPHEQWSAYMEVRKIKKAANTDRAINSVIKKLNEFRKEGFSLVEILENSIRSSWIDVYKPKADYGQKVQKSPRAGVKTL
jgi:uncharacterized protein YdaU (DUF1376 family)